MQTERKLKNIIKAILTPYIIASMEQLAETRLIRGPIKDADHIHVCFPQERFKVDSYQDIVQILKEGFGALLFHLYDSEAYTHLNKYKRNVIVWFNKNGISAPEILPLFNWDVYYDPRSNNGDYHGRERITIFSKELGLTEPIYVDIKTNGRKNDRYEVKRKNFDLEWFFYNKD